MCGRQYVRPDGALQERFCQLSVWVDEVGGPDPDQDKPHDKYAVVLSSRA